MLRQTKTVLRALYELFQDSGFSMAGAVAFSFVLSLFPFCIFLGAIAGYFGGAPLAKAAVEQLFQVVPAPVTPDLPLGHPGLAVASAFETTAAPDVLSKDRKSVV